MKLNLSGWKKGIIGLERRVIDFGRIEIRPRITEQDLQRYYEECLRKLGNYSQYFEYQEAFQKTREELLDSKRAKLVARDSVYSNFFSDIYHNVKVLYHRSHPEETRGRRKYFDNERYLALIPIGEASPYAALVDSSNKNIIEIPREEYHKFSERYKPRIEVPNDLTQPETKGLTFHGTLHHFTLNYRLNSRRLFTKNKAKNLEIDGLTMENCLDEAYVEVLTDLLLEDDKDALFECRWVHSSYKYPELLTIGTALSTGALITLGIFVNPIALPLAIIPDIVEKIIYVRYKESKKGELMYDFIMCRI